MGNNLSYVLYKIRTILFHSKKLILSFFPVYTYESHLVPTNRTKQPNLRHILDRISLLYERVDVRRALRLHGPFLLYISLASVVPHPRGVFSLWLIIRNGR